MFYFPQLSTGAIGQYPIQKSRVSRTVVNESTDGFTFKLADSNAVAVEWTLKFTTLSDAERDALALLYQNVEGQLGSFTFLDPTDNLLLWSEDLTQPAWTANSLLTITGGVADPNGGTSATQLSNTGSAALSAQQVINGPGWYQYAFSVQVSSSSNQQITLIRSTATASQSAVFTAGPDWTRIVLPGNFGGTDESVTFGIQLPPGGTVDLFGLQAEAQPGASGYKQTLDSGGVYPNARFLDDTLTIQTDGPGQHSCQISIHTQA
jgi:hypothetical protein